MELPDDVGADLGWVRSGPEGDPDAPRVRARQRGEPHSPKQRGASVSAAWPPGRAWRTKILDRLEVESKERRESATDVRLDGDGMAANPTTVTSLIRAAHTCLLDRLPSPVPELSSLFFSITVGLVAGSTTN